MSGLENVIKKIENDAKEKADAIIKAAEDAAAQKKREITQNAELEAQRILRDAEAEAERAKEQISTATALEIRNLKLAAKQEIIGKVFAEALNTLNDMESDNFEKFAMGFCKSANIKEGDEIIIPDKHKFIDVTKLNPALKPYKGDRKIDGGFVLISGGIERNNTFAALLDFYRSDLEPLVIQKLF